MITTLLWDVDGTLLDFLAAEKAAIRSLFDSFGLGTCTDGMVARYSAVNRSWWQRLERKEVTRAEALCGRFEEFFRAEGIDPALAPAFNRAYQVRLGDTVVFRDGSDRLVRELRGRVRQYVISNGTVIAQTRKLQASGLGALMDGIFLSEEVGFEKPDPAFFEKVLSVIPEKDRERMLVIGDSLTSDIKGANNAGIPACWYNPAGAPRDPSLTLRYEISHLSQIKSILF